jgi:hypothetical protein
VMSFTTRAVPRAPRCGQKINMRQVAIKTISSDGHR